MAIGFDVPRFDPATIAGMLEDFQALLARMVADPDQCVLDLPLTAKPARTEVKAVMPPLLT